MGTLRNRLLVIAALAGGAVFVALVVCSRGPWGVLVEDVQTLHSCLECHEGEDLHSCATCHDEHGDAVLSGITFDEVIELAGDVPSPGPVAAAKIVPRDAGPPGGLPLLDFLATQGAEPIERVVLFSGDGSQASMTRQELDDDSLLMPHTDGVRFADENHHYSTWLKGLTRIVVVGEDRPLRIDGQDTSIGRLLLGQTSSVTVEETEVMLADPNGDSIRRAHTARRLEGIPLLDVVDVKQDEVIVLHCADGLQRSITAAEASDALLVQELDGVTLVLPDRGRAAWSSRVVEVATRQQEAP